MTEVDLASGGALAAQIFTALILVVVGFQVALSLGAPWGALAMGGRFPGKFPPGMRIAALAQAVFLASLGVIVLIRSKLLQSDLYALSEVGIWVVVVVLGLSLIMNLATPSRWERIIWAPIAAILVSCSLIVAIT